MPRRLVSLVVSAASASLGLSCAPGGFRDETNLAEVRILASSADHPYAKPGQNVTLSVLAYDGRTSKPEPMQIYWVPIVCKDPTDDAYYGCFQQFAAALGGPNGGADAGAEGGRGAGRGAGAGPGGGGLPPGTTLPLPTGTSFQFRMPDDAVTAHPVVLGTPVPYGLAFLFNIACAGHIEALPLDPSNTNPIQVPLGCFDASGNQLPPDDYVIGYTRVYAFDNVTNANPVIDHVDVDGHPVDLSKGFTTDHCTTRLRAQCPKVHIGPVVPASSWELNPESRDENGNVLHEEIWADFYDTFGQVTSDARLLYDARTGSLGGPDATDDDFLPPNDPGDGFVWMVVHDNRGGAAWAQVPVHVN
jgi:hypothetical protein